MKPHIFPFTIAFADTDAVGIAYHARYIEIAERARMNFARNATPTDSGFVIKDLSIKYIKPLFLGDDFVVESLITKLGGASMTVEQKFVKNNETLAILNITAVYIDSEKKPKRFPDELLKLLETIKISG